MSSLCNIHALERPQPAGLLLLAPRPAGIVKISAGSQFQLREPDLREVDGHQK